MAKRRRKAANVKGALFRAADELYANGQKVDCNSVTEKLKKGFSAEIETDRDDLVDIGLRVLAGRITTLSMPSNEQGDLFEQEGFRRYYPVRTQVDGRKFSSAVPTRSLTPRMIDEQPEVTKTAKLRKNPILVHLDAMKEKGLWDVSLGDYLNGTY
jgi:hypothetical protein